MGQHQFADILENAKIPTSGKAFKVPTGNTEAWGWLVAWGVTKPADAATGYATGCLFLHTDGGDGSALYVNEGDADSADFNLITVAAA
jgi:hypothetical protein